jgi:Tfp pilus assembly protein PilW
VRGVGDIAEGPRRSEGGYTLIELLVAGTMAMVVLGGAVTVFIGAVRSEPRTSSKVSAIERGRIAVERITRELRQASDVVPAGDSGLAMITYLPQGNCGASAEGSEPCKVTYACTAAKCMRTVAHPDGSSPGAAMQVVDGLASNEVFDYSPSEAGAEPEYVEVELSFTTLEGGPVVVTDGAAPRNVGS